MEKNEMETGVIWGLYWGYSILFGILWYLKGFCRG